MLHKQYKTSVREHSTNTQTHTHTHLYIKYLYDALVTNKLQEKISFYLLFERVIHFLIVNGRLFHRVAAAFLKHLLLYVTPCIFGTVISASDSDLRDLVG